MFRFFKEPTLASPSPGYYLSSEKFKCMHVLYCGVTWEEAALMEAVLIASHLSKPGNRNVRPGGEGRQVGAGPFFTYVVFKSAMWRTLFGLEKSVNFMLASALAFKHSTIYGLFSTNDVQLTWFLPTSWLSPCSLYLFPTEVPCSQVIGFAKKALADSSGTASGVTTCPVVRRLAKIKDKKKAEEQVHPLFKEHSLSLPIELTPLDGELLGGYPRLKPIDFFNYMANTGNLNRLLGGRSIHSAKPFLEAFWKAYEVCHPDFGLYYQKDVDFGSCIPIYIHADGGRGFKKTELMVFNWSSAVGYGSGKQRASRRQFGRGRTNHPQVNLIGHSYTNHFLWAVMPQKWHKDDSRFHAMLDAFGEDLFQCYTEGIKVGNHCFRLVVLGLKADCKLQARAGRFTRWYATCRKSVYDPNKDKQTIGYCCWLCPAGHINYPFEEVHTERPRWLEVVWAFGPVFPLHCSPC